MKYIIYDHYISIDWAATNMAITRMTKKSNKITVIDNPSDITELQFYLKKLKGSKILTIEETTTSQWLYTELKDYADKILICVPYRNKLLKEDPGTDKLEATKLVHLLKAGFMKKVYHTNNSFIYLRRVVSTYEDLVKAGVRLKNQRHSLLRACRKKGKEKDIKLASQDEQFVLSALDKQIKNCEQEKKAYKKEFERLARIVSPFRFASNGHHLSYVGLIKHEKIGGGRSYGKKNKYGYNNQLLRGRK